MSSFRRLACNVTFIPEPEGGRRTVPQLQGDIYRPHLVVGDSQQRQAKTGPTTELIEDYLGVSFHDGPSGWLHGQEIPVTVSLVYAETGVSYAKLRPGATFTIREGANIVGFGTVVQSL